MSGVPSFVTVAPGTPPDHHVKWPGGLTLVTTQDYTYLCSLKPGADSLASKLNLDTD